jgi:glycosyltransferase involved in cell wall biosynthesis
VRICYSCHDSFPSHSTNTQQVFWTTAEVARLGAEVVLRIPSISAAGGSLSEMAQFYGMSARDVPPSLRVVAGGHPIAGGPIGEGLFDWRAPRRLSRKDHDLLWTRDPVAMLSAVRAGWPTVFETYRPDFATRLRFAPWRALGLRHPALLGVIVHSQYAADAFMAAGVESERCLVAHNGFAPSMVEPVLSRENARAMLDLAVDAPLVVYTGHAGPEKGIDVVVRIAAAVPSARFLLLGVQPDSADARRLADLAFQIGAQNVELRARVPVAQVTPYLYAADCLIVPPSGEPLQKFRRTVLPMKVFSYLAAGRPILAPRLPDIEELLTDGQTARLVRPDDVRAAADALTALLRDRDLQVRLGAAARDLSRQFTWSARAERITGFLAQRQRAAAGFSSSAAAASSRR